MSTELDWFYILIGTLIGVPIGYVVGKIGLEFGRVYRRGREWRRGRA